MLDDPRVDQLLDQILESERSPEEVCSPCPHLLPEVRRRWQQMCAVRAGLDALFPTAEPVPGTDTPAPWYPGTDLPRIPGYDVEMVIGQGGMGVVFRARHLRLGRSVALKMLLAGSYAGPQERARFRREAEAVAVLRHPNVVQVYDVGDADGRPYFTMEFMEGGSLAQKLAGVPQPAREAAQLLATLADAVEAAHQSGVIHRDLKPGNVLLTADGTPKISDFGLARRRDNDGGLTRTGAPLGTPSYMAPEQAAGQVHAVGPATDVYALGAILYELLTGRPPFRAETGAETVQQVIYQDPAPPARLNARVPRELETICLKCLHKDPERRYLSAAALADDLNRFRDGRPIRARPPSLVGRLWRWGRRNPAAAALIVAALAFVGLVVGGGFWFERQRTERREETARREERGRQAVEAALERAAAFRQDGRWPEARAALEGAPALLGTSAPADLRERLRQARADIETAAELEEIRLSLSAAPPRERTAPWSPGRLYAEAFRRYGIDLTTQEPADAAARVRSSAIRETLLAFLYDWLYWASDADRALVREVLDQADDDPWRRAYRAALPGKDPQKLKELAAAPEAPTQPPVILSGLGGALLACQERETTLALLRQAQRRNPADFWINFLLGHFWYQQLTQQAVGYFRAAVAIRPSSDQAYAMLGRALLGAGDADEGIAALRKSLELSPDGSVARDLAKALAPRGELEDVRALWENALHRDPRNPQSWYGYAPLCLFLGKADAYRRARTELLDRAGDWNGEWTDFERTSLACLLQPASGDELRRSVALADRAAAAWSKASDARNPYLQFLLGLAEYRQDRLGRAIPLLREASDELPNRAGPRLVLAMAQYRSGSPKEARKTLAAAVRAYNWEESRATHTTVWVSHVLRREAEALIVPRMPEFLRGTYQPRDNDERLALVGVCQSRRLYAAAARLFVEAFAGEPGLADELTSECLHRAAREQEQSPDRIDALDTEGRYIAARCAALASCGLGKDGIELSAAARAQWRKQARAWLHADLAALARALDSGAPANRDLVKKMLTLWRADRDLAGLREPNALQQQPADERKECLALWEEVTTVLNRAQTMR
jgi:tetratricopeptide (TPR) repeat protein